MSPVSISWQHTPGRHIIRVALLAVMSVAWHPDTLAAGQQVGPMSEVRCPMSTIKTSDIGLRTSVMGHRTSDVGLLVVASFINDIMGNRTRMIQVGCIVLAIGFFVLRQQYR
jgi:hypothetical protein